MTLCSARRPPTLLQFHNAGLVLLMLVIQFVALCFYWCVARLPPTDGGGRDEPWRGSR